MDTQRTIELLSYAQTFDNCNYGAIKIAIDKALEALEKQKPKTVAEYGKYGFKCPCCNEDLGLEREEILIYDMTPPKYCDNCGQMLNWEWC